MQPTIGIKKVNYFQFLTLQIIDVYMDYFWYFCIINHI